MLILARRAGESFWLGDDVEIRIVDLTPSRVRVGIVAPRSLGISRGEVRQTAEHNRAASSTDVSTAQKLLNDFRFVRYGKAPGS